MKLGFDFGTCFSHIQCMVGKEPRALIKTNIYMGKPSEYLHGVGNGYDFTPYEKFANSGKLIKDLKPKLRNNGANYKDEEVDGAPTIGEIVKGFLCYYVNEQKKALNELKESAHYELIKDEIEEITITIPLAQGNFLMDDDYSNHLRNFLSKGLGLPKSKIHVLPEPFAAAISYLKGQKEDANILVFDLGGGTLDVTVVEYNNNNKKKYTQIANAGRNIGGNDWDKELKTLVKKKLKLSTDALYERGKMAEFESKIVALKHELTTEKARPFLWDRGVCYVERDEFEQATTELRKEAMSAVDEVLKVAKRKGISQSNINKVFLAGGGCEMPQIEQAMKEKFGWKVCKEKPLLSIAKGAAIWSYMIGDGLVEDMVQQSTSHAYGFNALMYGKNYINVMIEKNQEFQDGIISYKTTNSFSPVKKNQTQVSFTLYELDDSELKKDKMVPITKGKSLNKKTTIEVPDEYYSANKSCDYKVSVEYRLTAEMELTMIIYDEQGNVLEEKSFLIED